MPPDFSSAEYWAERFQHELHFEWLSISTSLIPLIKEHIPAQGVIYVLHFGAGTSTLGRDLVEADETGRVHVVDADYIHEVMDREDGDGVFPRRCVGLMLAGRYTRIGLDVLSLASLRDVTPPGGWDVYVDKSTADAISCGPDEAFTALCSNLAACAKPTATWVCISYSSTRFDDVKPWKVQQKLALKTTGGQNGGVWEPEVVAVWAYILSKA